MAGPTAKSLVLDLLSTVRRGSMPVSALVAAGELFALPENAMRVAVARLLAAGTVARDERGRYRLGAAAEAIDGQVRAWSRREDTTRSWGGDWLAVHAGGLPAPRRPALRRRERALRLFGFAGLGAGLALRPDNLRAGPEQLRRELCALGLEEGALVFRMSGLDVASEARARGLWDAEALRAGYARSLRDVEESAAQLPRQDEASAMVESFLLGGRVIRQLVLDPLLPEPIVPVAERRALVEAMRRYDRLGRRAWAGFMERHGAPAATAPSHGVATSPALLH